MAGDDGLGKRNNLPFSNITVYDMDSKERYWQQTTGKARSRRHL